MTVDAYAMLQMFTQGNPDFYYLPDKYFSILYKLQLIRGFQ